MIKIRKRRLVLLIVGVVIATLLAGFVGLNLFAGAKNMVWVNRDNYETMEAIANKYSKLYSIQKTINEGSLWETDEDAQMDAIYKTLLGTLNDDYSRYMTEEEYAAWSKYVNGTFYGIGLTFVENDDGDYEVIKVLQDSPAAAAGLKEGDLITKIDGKAYKNSDDMVTNLRGAEGTRVTLTYERAGRERNVDLVRSEIAEQSVYAGTIQDHYGYIAITAFEKKTAEQFRTELAGMENNKDIKGIVIDLRGNRGGYMEQGIEIADMLLPECTITHTENRKGEKEYYNSDSDCTDLPYVLLVNENSASASEIVAAAIKENNGGKLVGTTTFGKGIIQSTMAFKDNTAMTFTIMKYLSPKGNEIHEVGVTPDVKVTLPENAETDVQLEKAVSLLK